MPDMARRDHAIECEPGMVRLFGAGDIGTRGMVSGWAGPEEGHNWNDGPEAVMTLAIIGPPRRLRLDVMGEPYITRVRPTQEVTLFGNGHRGPFRRLTTRAETLLSILLDVSWWDMRGHQSWMRMIFHLPNSVRPKDIADGADGREIGFCFRSLHLSEPPD